jgi:proteasome accessory factor A
MQKPHERIFGVETEFGCLVADESLGNPAGAVEAIKDFAFYDLKVGALDLHSRDEVFEPAESGGFLINGARLYIDAVGSHLEYATAECRSIKDLIANDRAGHRWIVRALRELGLDDSISVYNNSVDHFGGHTFGCHENYLVKADEELLGGRIDLLYPFLVTRQIFAGVGRVGGHVLVSGFRPSYQEMVENPIDYIWVSNVYSVVPDPDVKFQLSQRADHILKTVASRVRFNRALINPKWETFYSYNGMTRFHVLFGESNQNEYAYALKVGTTRLAIRTCEDGIAPFDVQLASPLIAMRQISRDESYKWLAERLMGGTISAIDVQRAYLEAAQVYRGESDETDWVLNEWEATLNGLETDPMEMGDRLDWVAKKKIVESYMESEKLDWSDDALHSVDLEYHNINPDLSLYGAWCEMNPVRKVVSELDVTMAMTDPPSDTRAKGRAKLIEKILERKKPGQYAIDWNGVQYDKVRYIEMNDPFDTYESVQDQWGNDL